tara:strand:+ start:589 stop:819 length:231 start_codon:yes stop_codon:yes gene_type:complete
MRDVRQLFDMVRNPMYNWNDAYTMSTIPEEGTKVKIGRWVEDEYEVAYVRDEEGNVVEWKHIKVKPEKEISYGGTE